MEQIAVAMEAVRDAEAAARAELADSLQEVHDELMPHFEGIMDHFRAIASIGSVGEDEPRAARPASVEQDASAPASDRPTPAM